MVGSDDCSDELFGSVVSWNGRWVVSVCEAERSGICNFEVDSGVCCRLSIVGTRLEAEERALDKHGRSLSSTLSTWFQNWVAFKVNVESLTSIRCCTELLTLDGVV